MKRVLGHMLIQRYDKCCEDRWTKTILRDSSIKTLQEHARPILTKELWEQIEITNQLGRHRFEYRLLGFSKTERVLSPWNSWSAPVLTIVQRRRVRNCLSNLQRRLDLHYRFLSRIVLPLPLRWATGLPAEPRGAKKNKWTWGFTWETIECVTMVWVSDQVKYLE